MRVDEISKGNITILNTVLFWRMATVLHLLTHMCKWGSHQKNNIFYFPLTSPAQPVMGMDGANMGPLLLGMEEGEWTHVRKNWKDQSSQPFKKKSYIDVFNFLYQTLWYQFYPQGWEGLSADLQEVQNFNKKNLWV